MLLLKIFKIDCQRRSQESYVRSLPVESSDDQQAMIIGGGVRKLVVELLNPRNKYT